MEIREKITQEALSYLGVPYRHQGRTRHGIDCVGLPITVGNTLGLIDFDILAYGRRANAEGEFLSHFESAGCVRRLTNKLQPGQILLFRERVLPCHSGIYLGNNEFIHALLPARKVIRDRLDGDWRGKLFMSFDYPGV